MASARWEWLRENAPNPQNPEVSRKLLGELSQEDWQTVQQAYGQLKVPAGGVGTPSRKKTRVLGWPTDLFLRKHAFLQFRSKTPKPRPASAPVKVVELDPAQELETRLVQVDGYLMQLLNDPDVPEAKKQAAREKWLATPENKGRRPPWKLPTSNGNGHHRTKGLPS